LFHHVSLLYHFGFLSWLSTVHATFHPAAKDWQHGVLWEDAFGAEAAAQLQGVPTSHGLPNSRDQRDPILKIRV